MNCLPGKELLVVEIPPPELAVIGMSRVFWKPGSELIGIRFAWLLP